MIGFQNSMIGIFGEFLRGGGVVRVDNPSELYFLYDILRDTTYNFFNLNKTSDAQLIAMTGSRNPRYMDLSRDRMTQVGGDSVRSEEVILRERCLFYHLRDNYGFEGFPVFFHVREIWDDNLYALDRKMVATMGVPENLVHQVEGFYETGINPLIVNEFNPSTLIPSIRVTSTTYQIQKADVDPNDPNAEFRADLLVNTLRPDMAYPICVLTDMIIATIKSMQAFTKAQTDTEFYTNIIMCGEMDRIVATDDPYNGYPENYIWGLLSKLRGITHSNGQTVLKLDNVSQLRDMDKYFSYLAKGDPTKIDIRNLPIYVEGEDPFPLYFYYDGVYGLPHFDQTVNDGVTVVTYDEIIGIKTTIEERFDFIINVLSPILMSFPMRGTVVPAKFVHSIRDVMYQDMVSQENPQKPN